MIFLGSYLWGTVKLQKGVDWALSGTHPQPASVSYFSTLLTLSRKNRFARFLVNYRWHIATGFSRFKLLMNITHNARKESDCEIILHSFSMIVLKAWQSNNLQAKKLCSPYVSAHLSTTDYLNRRGERKAQPNAVSTLHANAHTICVYIG